MSAAIQSKRNPEIQYFLATVSDVEEIALFLKENFFTREPLSVASKVVIGPEEWEWLLVFVQNNVRSGLTFKAIDTSKNNQLAAVKLARIVKTPKVPEIEEAILFNKCGIPIHAIFGFAGKLEENVQLNEIYSVTSYLMNEFDSVKDEYGGKGLCTEMLGLIENNAMQIYKVQLSVFVSTNIYGQKMYLKNGYKIENELEFKWLKVGEKFPLKSTEDGAKKGRLMVKYFG